MKRNETSARGASKHAPVKNAGSRRLRSLTAAAFIVMTGIGLAWHTGWGTLSSFGIGSIAEVCPLGARRQDLPAAGLLRTAGRRCRRRAFRTDLLRLGLSRAASAPHHGHEGRTARRKGGGVLFENRDLHAVCVRILHLRRKGRRSRVD